MLHGGEGEADAACVGCAAEKRGKLAFHSTQVFPVGTMDNTDHSKRLLVGMQILPRVALVVPVHKVQADAPFSLLLWKVCAWEVVEKLLRFGRPRSLDFLIPLKDSGSER